MESDAGVRQEQPPILYETLNPLSFSPTSPPSPTPMQQQLSSNGDYIVLRSDVISSNPIVPPVELPTADYFSLDVNDDLDDEQSNYRTPSPAPCLPGDSVTVQKTALESSWFRGNCRFKSPMLQLHKEILDFCEFLSPTLEEQAARDVAVQSVSDVIKYIWPNCEVEVFGSFKTGLYLPTSDIDVVILESDVSNTQQALYALSRALSQRGIAKKIQVIAKARVPIIKFVEKQSGVSFDISFDVENGPKAAEFIKVSISKLPPLRPLCLILKVFLQQRELNEVYSGGIGSYALLAMLIAMLQSLRESNASPEQNLGILLINFFDVYGRKLNTSDVGVSCHGAGTFFLKKSRGFLNKGRPHLLSIEDPQAPDNDIGKNSFNYFQIKSAFAMAFSTLTNAKIISGLGPDRSILGTIIRPDPVLLERKGGSNGDVTFSSLLPGSGELIPIPFGDQQMFCNWQLDGAEEPFQRENSASENHNSRNSSRKKRKASESAAKENGRSPKDRSEENGSKKDRTGKKRRWRHSKRDRVAV